MSKQNYTAPFLVTDQMDYLVANGFSMSVVAHNGLLFTKDGLQVRIVNDVMYVLRWQEGDGENAAGYREEQQFNHVSALDETQWWFLLDAFDVVRIKDFVRRAHAEDKYALFVNLGQAMVPADS